MYLKIFLFAQMQKSLKLFFAIKDLNKWHYFFRIRIQLLIKNKRRIVEIPTLFSKVEFQRGKFKYEYIFYLFIFWFKQFNQKKILILIFLAGFTENFDFMYYIPGWLLNRLSCKILFSKITRMQETKRFNFSFRSRSKLLRNRARKLKLIWNSCLIYWAPLKYGWWWDNLNVHEISDFI